MNTVQRESLIISLRRRIGAAEYANLHKLAKDLRAQLTELLNNAKTPELLV